MDEPGGRRCRAQPVPLPGRHRRRPALPALTATPPELPPPAPAAAGPEGKVVLPEGVRQAATDYVLETMRKRLER